MIRGNVEIIKDFGTSTEEIIFIDKNMIVDGAGEIIATMMTIPPNFDSLSSASSIYNTSNFTIQAISFGKAQDHYLFNAHELSGPAEYGRTASGQVWVSGTGVSGASSYTPAYFVPTAPSPIDTQLVEVNIPALQTEYEYSYEDVIAGLTNVSGVPTSWGLYSQFPELSNFPTLNFSSIGTTTLGLNLIGLDTSGKVYNWGLSFNTYGEMNTPTGLPPCKAVAVGQYASYAITSAGNLVYWGGEQNLSAVAGTATWNKASSGISDIAISNTYVHLLKNDGTVSALKTKTTVSTPNWLLNLPAGIQGNVNKIFCGEQHVVYLLNNNSACAVAIPSTSNDGVSATSGITSPLSNISDVACGRTFTLFATSSGYVSGYGNVVRPNSTSQTNRVSVSSLIPSSIQGQVKRVFAGQNVGFILLNDNSLLSLPVSSNISILNFTLATLPNGFNFNKLKLAYSDVFALGLYSSSVPYYETITSVTENIASLNNGLYYGQNPNIIPFIGKKLKTFYLLGEAKDIIPDASSALFDGCYAPSDGITVKIVSGSEPYTKIVSATVSGALNTIGAMDFRGFIKSTNLTNSLSGLVTSSVNLSANGEVIYIFTLHNSDVLMSNLYGGINNMGLWAYDISENLKQAQFPPFTFRRYPEESGTFISPLKYKLFAKKVFNTNICGIRDDTTNSGLLNHQNLTIRWRLYFV